MARTRGTAISETVLAYLQKHSGIECSIGEMAHALGYTGKQVTSAAQYLHIKYPTVERPRPGVYQFFTSPARSTQEVKTTVKLTELSAGSEAVAAKWREAEIAGGGITVQTKFRWIGYRYTTEGERQLLLRGDNGKIYTAQEL
jgi:hypothetical protein